MSAAPVAWIAGVGPSAGLGAALARRFTTMLIALVVFDGVHLAEIIRAGIQGVPRGQENALARWAWATGAACGSWSSHRPCEVIARTA